MAAAISITLFVVLLAAISGFGYFKYVRPARTFYQLAMVSSALAAEMEQKHETNWLGRVLGALGKLAPVSTHDLAYTKKRLAAAGFRSERAVTVLSGLKIIGAAIFLLAGVFCRRHITDAPVLQMLVPVGAAVLGYLAPGIVLDRLTAKRREQIRFALPDALDMLVVCSEVGCALDQAIQNVSREFQDVHPALSDELGLVNMEILAGASRATALRNFAERTGEEETKKLVAIMIQTDRFGTSIAESLRTQSDYMRVRRRQQAEERAGKVGVKLVFPIFFFCMPSLMIIVAGPGILQLFYHFFPALTGNP